MSSNKRKYNTSDESSSSSSTQYSMRSFITAATSPPSGPDPEDRGWYASNRTYPIVAADLIVKPWTEEGLREAVMGEIRTLDNWVSMDVFRRGVSTKAAECPPTIIVTINPGTMDERCKDVAEKIKGHIEKYNLDAAVEIIEGTVERYKALHDIGKSARMGSSIALADEIAGTGTLGGYVRLESPEMGHKLCALTSHHVLISKDSSSRDVFENGFHPECLQASDRLVESPSKTDVENSIAAQIVLLERQQNRLQETKEKIDSGMASETRKGCLEKEIKAVEIASERIRELETFDRQLGCVLASSGFRVASTGCGLDWGLVEVNRERVAGNLVRTIENVFIPHTDRVTETCELDEKKKVYKFGRTSGSTEGRWNHVQSEVRLPDSPHETTEQAFIATGDHGPIFATNGDSGAWVLNDEAKLGGLLVGGHPGRNWIYVTPISVVFADIEAHLDCKVKLADE